MVPNGSPPHHHFCGRFRGLRNLPEFSKEKKQKTYPKIRSNPDAIIIKLADRIANVEWGGMTDMYTKEFAEFQDVLRIKDHATKMWEHLEKLLVAIANFDK